MIEAPARIITINSTADQSRTALVWMTKLIERYKADPTFVAIARGILDDAGTLTAQDEAEAVRHWIQRNITYRNDPEGTQYIQGPVQTMSVRSGNCDCMSVLAGTFLAALGHVVYPLGVCWEGENAPTHAVLFDADAELIVDPVAEVPARCWPPQGYILSHFVHAW